MRKLPLFLLLVAYNQKIWGDSSTVFKAKFYPFAFYTKETSLSAGFSSLCFFPNKSDSIHYSNVQFTAQYSLNRQSNVEFWYQLFLRKDRYRIYGFADHNNFPTLFFGIGNMPQMAEMYTGKFQRFRFSGLRRINKNWMGGIRYWFENFTLLQTEVKGMLSQYPSKHLHSSPGILLQGDSRDNQFFPKKGMMTEFSLLVANEFFGGSTNFKVTTIDYRKYLALHRKAISATQLFLQVQLGDPSYNQLSMAGGAKILRGYYLGKYRDKSLLAFQQEIRFILSQRFKYVVFGSMGSVNSRLALKPKTLLLSAGNGIRFALDKEKQIHLRADLAITREGDRGIYLMLEEAF